MFKCLRRAWFAGGLCSFLAGCTVLTSETIEQLIASGSRARGVYYSLSKGVIEVTLSVDPTTLAFALELGDEIEYIPDRNHKYFLNYRPLPNYHDQIVAKVNDKSFLTHVKSTTIDKTGNVLVNLAKAFGAITGAGVESASVPESREVLFSAAIDPTDDNDRNQTINKINNAINTYVQNHKNSCLELADDNLSAYGKWEGEEFKSSNKLRNRQSYRGTVLSGLQTVRDQILKSLQAPNLGPKQSFEAADLVLPDLPTYPANMKVGEEKEICEKTVLTDPEHEHICFCHFAFPDLATDNSRHCETDIFKKAGYLQHINYQINKWQGLETQAKDAADSAATRGTAHKHQRARCEVIKKFKAPNARIEVKSYRSEAQHRLQDAAWRGGSKGHWQAYVDPEFVQATKTDCSVGICYRAKEPWRIDYALENAHGLKEGNGTRIVELPNKSDLVALDIRRAFLVEKVSHFEFDANGFLTKAYVKKPSELLALSELPLNIMDAVLEGFSLRFNILSEQKNVAEREIELLKAKKKLSDFQLASGGGVGGVESAILTQAANPSFNRVTSFTTLNPPN